jgi:tubulin--tyrosine ligase-like protein 12
LRYIVLLKSVAPLEVYVYNMFWIRLANVSYSLSDFEEYEKHFTVMNYSKFNLTQLHYKDFIKSIESQYPGVKWDTVQSKINQAFRQAFEAASVQDAPLGFVKAESSR